MIASQSSTSWTLRLSGIEILTSGRFKYSSSCTPPAHSRISQRLGAGNNSPKSQNACTTYAFALASALLPSRGSSSRRPGHADDADALGFRRLFRLEGFAFCGVARALRLDEGFLLPDALLVVLVEALFGNPLVPPDREQKLTSASRLLNLRASSADAMARGQHP